ncbi:hypothetical protein FB451DRAFT_1363640 [Mycena latifolia]|nr:hypothetical protein FB451DRAFT_1363640 [Mycena latifolia]
MMAATNIHGDERTLLCDVFANSVQLWARPSPSRSRQPSATALQASMKIILPMLKEGVGRQPPGLETGRSRIHHLIPLHGSTDSIDVLTRSLSVLISTPPPAAPDHAARRRKMIKLVNMLGGPIPLSTVFPPPSKPQARTSRHERRRSRSVPPPASCSSPTPRKLMRTPAAGRGPRPARPERGPHITASPFGGVCPCPEHHTEPILWHRVDCRVVRPPAIRDAVIQPAKTWSKLEILFRGMMGSGTADAYSSLALSTSSLLDYANILLIYRYELIPILSLLYEMRDPELKPDGSHVMSGSIPVRSSLPTRILRQPGAFLLSFFFSEVCRWQARRSRVEKTWAQNYSQATNCDMNKLGFRGYSELRSELQAAVVEAKVRRLNGVRQAGRFLLQAGVVETLAARPVPRPAGGKGEVRVYAYPSPVPRRRPAYVGEEDFNGFQTREWLEVDDRGPRDLDEPGTCSTPGIDGAEPVHSALWQRGVFVQPQPFQIREAEPTLGELSQWWIVLDHNSKLRAMGSMWTQQKEMSRTLGEQRSKTSTKFDRDRKFPAMERLVSIPRRGGLVSRGLFREPPSCRTRGLSSTKGNLETAPVRECVELVPRKGDDIAAE